MGRNKVKVVVEEVAQEEEVEAVLYPCVQCSEEVDGGGVFCVMCNQWWHYKCDRTTERKVKTQFPKGTDYTCKAHMKRLEEENKKKEKSKDKLTEPTEKLQKHIVLLKEKSEEVKKLRKELSECQLEAERGKKALEEINDLRNKNQVMASQQKVSKKIEEDNSKEIKRLQDCNVQLKEQKKNHETAHKTLKNNNIILKDKLSKAEAKTKELEAKTKELEAEIEKKSEGNSAAAVENSSVNSGASKENDETSEPDWKKERKKLQNDLKKIRTELEECRKQKDSLASDVVLNKSVIFHLTEKLDMAKIIHKDLEIAVANHSTPLRNDTKSSISRYTVLDETYGSEFVHSEISREEKIEDQNPKQMKTQPEHNTTTIQT